MESIVFKTSMCESTILFKGDLLVHFWMAIEDTIVIIFKECFYRDNSKSEIL